ncbi:MAG: diguanylate cyclase [Chloroflexi bacterium]|nr:diguanylate cyclase [Chloroflexota bacterium]
MSKPILNVLLIDDDEDEYLIVRDMVAGTTRGEGAYRINLNWVATYEEAVEAISQNKHDVYLIDYRLGSYSGIDLLRRANELGSTAPLIILTGQGSYDVDLAAMQSGAADYLTKTQLSLPLLERSIRYALERTQARNELESLVRERTKELEEAKADLEIKVAERTRELQQRAEELSALNAATSSLLTTLDLDELLGKILDAAQHALPAAEKGWLHMIAPETGQLQLRQAMQFTDERIQRVPLPHNQNYLSRVILERKPLVIHDTLQELQDGQPAVPGDPASIRSMIVAPLLLEGAVQGVLSLGSSQPSAFREENMQLLVSFATTASAAIQNAQLHAQLQRLATEDPLTGALNRRAFEELGQREIERFNRFGRPLSALMFDLDNLKTINDTYGHAIGDRALLTITEDCRKHLRRVDIFGRYGGDEFAILLPETDTKTAVDVAQRIMQQINETALPINDHEIHFSISLGVATYTHETRDLSTLMRHADMALYEAKEKGKNRIEIYSPESIS